MTSFVAEVSSNHHQDLERCFAFIRVAAGVGCDAVKFQLFRIDELFAPEILQRSEAHRARRQWELPPAFLPELRACCDENRIAFSCTPFYLRAVDELAPHVAFFKIASYELLWHDLLAACAQTGLPIVLSTGMASLDEVDAAVETLRRAGNRDLTLLHCVSAYPTPEREANLAVMGLLRERYGGKIGWSDHTVSPAVMNRAVHRWNADLIEFHLDLDAQGAEYAAGHCWLPEQIRGVISDARRASLIDGVPIKALAPSEADDRDWRADPSDGLRPRKHLRGVS